MVNYSDYIGIPFVKNGRDINGLDCYGLVMLLYKKIYNIDLPDYASPDTYSDIEALMNTEKQKWLACDIEVGSVLIFSIKGYGCHVGMVIEPDKMIHTWESTNGVTIERISLSWQNRIMGCYKWN